MLKMKITRSEKPIVRDIAIRARRMALAAGIKRAAINFEMDIAAVHNNDVKLRLSDLLAADDFNFSHDVFGIYQHLDRSTGKLGDCFLPRFVAMVVR
jgi:hypothetical protein